MPGRPGVDQPSVVTCSRRPTTVDSTTTLPVEPERLSQAERSGAADGFLDQGDDGRTDAQLADAQADQGGGEVGLAREVSADGDGFVAEGRTGHEDQCPDRARGAGEM